MRRGWADFASDYPATLYAPEDLMPYAAEIAREIDVIVYYALFLALAEHSGALTVTADMKPLSVLEVCPTSASRSLLLTSVALAPIRAKNQA